MTQSPHPHRIILLMNQAEMEYFFEEVLIPGAELEKWLPWIYIWLPQGLQEEKGQEFFLHSISNK